MGTNNPLRCLHSVPSFRMYFFSASLDLSFNVTSHAKNYYNTTAQVKSTLVILPGQMPDVHGFALYTSELEYLVRRRLFADRPKDLVGLRRRSF